MRRINLEQSPAEVDFATSMDDSIALSLWYSTVYVVIEGWREAGISDSEVDEILADDRVDDLRRFRNQIFHYQPKYDNPKLLEFLRTGDVGAQEATNRIRRTHAVLGRAIERALQDLVASQVNGGIRYNHAPDDRRHARVPTTLPSGLPDDRDSCMSLAAHRGCLL